jgi:hypothetical protein
MRILVAIGRDSECVDPVHAIRSLPWTADAVFTVLSVSEIVPVPAMLDVIAVVRQKCVRRHRITLQCVHNGDAVRRGAES